MIGLAAVWSLRPVEAPMSPKSTTGTRITVLSGTGNTPSGGRTMIMAAPGSVELRLLVLSARPSTSCKLFGSSVTKISEAFRFTVVLVCCEMSIRSWGTGTHVKSVVFKAVNSGQGV